MNSTHCLTLYHLHGDPRQAGLLTDCRALGFSEVEAIAIEDLFFLRGSLTDVERDRIASELLVDAVVGGYRWDDPTPGKDEIGDICNQDEVSFTGTDGQSYTVQSEWSNFNNACVAFPQAGYYVDGATGSDFSYGTPTHPFKTVRAAHNFVPANGKTTIYVRPGSYQEPPLPLNLNKPAQVLNWNGGGVVHVGNP